MRKFFSNERGAVVIELALIAPIFLLFVVGIVDMSNAYTRKLQLEQAAQRAIEKIQQTTQNKTIENTLKDEVVCQVNGTDSSDNCITSSPITTDNVTVAYRLECTNADGTVEVQTNIDSATDCTSSQTQAQYLSVHVIDKYTPMFPIHFGTDADGTYHLAATAGMRTE
jgi:Flp pilus assembly protein TadG